MIIGGPALTKYNDRTIRNLTTAPASVTSAPGALVHIKTLTASSSSTLSFVDGASSVVLDSTYPIYKFEFINIHPATDDKAFSFQANASGGSGYNETITSTQFQAYHREDDGAAALNYNSGSDQAQGTSFQDISGLLSNDNDASASGELFIYNPSSTTFVKHFMSKFQDMEAGTSKVSVQLYTAGYFNTTSAIDEFQFKMSSGNIDAGTIKLYGIKDS